MKHKGIRGTCGFTLVELMVAAALLGIALFATAASLLNLQDLSDLAREKIVAVSDANRILEAMRERANTSLANLRNTDWVAWANANVLGQRGANEIRLDQEAAAAALTGTDPVQVTLDINWSHRRRAQNHRVLTLMTVRDSGT